MIYFISDTHFYHEKIIEYVNRPFKDVEEMNNTLIDNWNKRIEPKDEVYILGDFSFGNKEQTLDLLDKLNGRKYLIKGNHDRVIKDKEVASRFEWIKDYHMLKYKKYKFVLFHYPLMVWDCQHYGAIHLYGLASEIFSDINYLKIAEKCSISIWERGLLLKGNCVCHGISGSVYSMYKLYQLTKKRLSS